MNIFPAVDLIDGKAVRLQKGDYDKMTVYSDSPLKVAQYFERCGAEYIHMVDLQGALRGAQGNVTDNIETVLEVCRNTALKIEVGGGIRNMQVIERYLNSGVLRVILGTAAIEDRGFLESAVRRFGDHIAVGADIKDGFVATHGWTKASELTCDAFLAELDAIGVRTVICTDISKDGMMNGTNLALYRELNRRYSMDLIASGGVSSLADVAALRDMGVYGAILGKAIYTGAVDLTEALKTAKAEG
ncbi:MAG: 1-(5-phosphoribosyl)-5-[(5-phosphoribosylamino)methylideneamino]imidazole-4-carboxamide isomerase [Acutalibacteraceae bacterium]